MTTLFADDQDILRYEPELTVYLPSTQADFTPQHIAASEALLDDLKKKNIIKEEAQILKPEELKQAAIFKALAIIFNFLSSNEGDKFAAKSDNNLAKYENELDQLMQTMTVDQDGDFTIDESEIQASHQPRLERQ